VITELEADLTIVSPDSPNVGEHVTVHGAAEVEDFVARLARPGVDNAYTTHAGRPCSPPPDADDGDMTPIPDHVATLAVRDGFGYFHYVGGIGAAGDERSFSGYAVGEQDSPATWVDGATLFPAGSGIPLSLFTKALAEFLATGELPACVSWVNEDDVHAGRFELG
jgi:hypothetical protein